MRRKKKKEKTKKHTTTNTNPTIPGKNKHSTAEPPSLFPGEARPTAHQQPNPALLLKETSPIPCPLRCLLPCASRRLPQEVAGKAEAGWRLLCALAHVKPLLEQHCVRSRRLQAPVTGSKAKLEGIRISKQYVRHDIHCCKWCDFYRVFKQQRARTATVLARSFSAVWSSSRAAAAQSKLGGNPCTALAPPRQGPTPDRAARAQLPCSAPLSCRHASAFPGKTPWLDERGPHRRSRRPTSGIGEPIRSPRPPTGSPVTHSTAARHTAPWDKKARRCSPPPAPVTNTTRPSNLKPAAMTLRCPATVYPARPLQPCCQTTAG